MNTEVEIDGETYILDTEAAESYGVLKKVLRRHVGQLYTDTKSQNVFIVAAGSHQKTGTCWNQTALLVCLTGGPGDKGRTSVVGHVTVNDLENISREEWGWLTAGSPDRYELVTKSVIIQPPYYA